MPVGVRVVIGVVPPGRVVARPARQVCHGRGCILHSCRVCRLRSDSCKRDHLYHSAGGHHGDHQAAGAILDAATRLFADEGINATSVDRVIAEADVAPMTVYRQFGGGRAGGGHSGAVERAVACLAAG